MREKYAKNTGSDEIDDWELCELISSLKSKNRFKRLNALFIIENLNDKRLIEPLIELTKENDRATKEYALYLLAKIENHVLCGDKVIKAFIDALNDENPSIRSYASLVLGDFGDYAATKPLILALKDEDEGVREEVMNALSNILISMGTRRVAGKI